MYKYLQQLTRLGLANLSTIVPTSHPPLPYCPNSSSIELLGFADWLECTHPLAVEHTVTRLTQTIWDWSHCLSGPHQDWMTPGGYVAPGSHPQHKTKRELWQAFATMDFINISSSSTWDLGLKHMYRVRACTQPPYTFLVGQLNASVSEQQLRIECINCNLTNCVST